MDTSPIIFPDLAGKRWKNVNLNELARRDYPDVKGDNRLLKSAACDAFVRRVACHNNVDFTYGGYLEDRSHLWRGHYFKPGMIRHLGVDYNVPAGTRVTAPAACEVVAVFRDLDQGGGWGGRLLFRLERAYQEAEYFLYAHLAHDSLPDLGDFFGRGDLVGVVGAAGENGGWFSHLHVQCLRADVVLKHGLGLEGLDGYGRYDLTTRPDMPDPTALMAGHH